MAYLTLSLLGQFTVTRDGEPVVGFRSAKVRGLLAYLSLEADHPHSREALAALLWPDVPAAAAHTYLRQALANLRGLLGEPDPPYLLISREGVQVNLASDYDLDVTTFRALLIACAQHAHRDAITCRACARRLAQAVGLYRGDLLEQFLLEDSATFQEWAVLKREQLHHQALGALARLADYCTRRGVYEEAQHWARRQLELDPWCEEAHQQLMDALWRSGQRSAALMQYERCRQILQEALGVEPAPAITALYQRIRTGEPPTSAAGPARQLPAPTTSFVGRRAELAHVVDLLEHRACRLVTVVGPGGIGKTRLVLQAAAELEFAFAHGVHFVALAAVRSADLLVLTLATTLNLSLTAGSDPTAQLRTYLRDKQLLLILDNLEHLLAPEVDHGDAVAGLLLEILHTAPGVTLLVTSRERLQLPGEWLVELSGLRYPMGEPGEDVAAYGAVQLFVQRAQQVRRQFVLTDGEMPSVARICRLVEGMPLAIELAAAALRGRSCVAIADAIAGSLAALTVELRAMPERHRSIRATFEHSWRLLAEQARQIFPRLSVFRGGFDEEAALQVAGATSALLTALVDKSLLRWDGAARYDIHELVRQYAGEKLDEAGETASLRRQQAAYFLALAEASEPELRARQVTPWLDRITAELDNLRAALSWSRTSAGDCVVGLRIAGALEYYWLFRNNSEGRGWLEGLLAQEAAAVAAMPQMVVDRGRLRARAKALGAAGMLAEGEGALALARACLEESATLCQRLEERHGLADALLGLAHLAWTQGATARAAQLSEECLRVSRAADDVATAGRCLWLLSNIAREQGDLTRAQTLADTAHAHAREFKLPLHIAYALHSASRVRLALGNIALARSAAEEALALGRQLGHPIFIAHALLQLGRVAEAAGDQARAVHVWEQAIGIARDAQHLRAMAEILLDLGWAEHQQGNDERARALLMESLRLYCDRGHQAFIAECLAGLAGVVGGQAATPADACHAARLYGAVDAMHGGGTAMLRPGDRLAYTQDVTSIRARLGESIFATAWDEGRAMTVEQAVANALEVGAADTAASVSVASSIH